MLYLMVGGAALALILWGGGLEVFKARGWRLLSGAFALAAFSAAAFVGLRGGWGKAIVLVIVGLWLASLARRLGPWATASRAGPRPAPEQAPPTSLNEARSILGVGPEATRAEIKAAHARLMRMAHPDKGGTSGLAAQLNAARDRLLSA
jgi:hypothetical protein